MNPFAIAGVQMEVREGQDNLPRMASHLADLVGNYPWVQMVVFSELCACGQTAANAQPLPGPAEEAFQAMAKRHGVWLIPGSLYERAEGRIYNTTSVIDPDGNVIGRYRKMFPFYPYENGVAAGTEPLLFDVPGVGRFGMSICYDMWFPETTRTLVAQYGAEVILHPSLTDSIDREVELAIVRSTAACNQCFVIDVNGLGDGGNGQSIFVGPAGDVLYQADLGEREIPLEIDLDRVRRSREVGLRGLGQPLKSFRDRVAQFPIYEPGRRSSYLDGLGRLEKPVRGSRAGLDARHAMPNLASAPPAAPEVGKEAS